MGLKEIGIKLAINAVLLYGLALLCGGRIKFRGLVPVLSVAIFLVPLNVFAPALTRAIGLPDRLAYVFATSVVSNGAMLYALSYAIPRFSVENFRVALAFAAIMGAVSVFLNFFVAERIGVFF